MVQKMGACVGNCMEQQRKINILKFFHMMDLDFDGVQGKARGRSFHSSPDLAKWLAMRPMVVCDDNVMAFTASGEGFTSLFVNRGKMFES